MAKKTAIKFPRVVVSAKRHTQLSQEAKKRGINIAELAEEAFAKVFPGKK